MANGKKDEKIEAYDRIMQRLERIKSFVGLITGALGENPDDVRIGRSAWNGLQTAADEVREKAEAAQEDLEHYFEPHAAERS
jgi:hypothetical protein